MLIIWLGLYPARCQILEKRSRLPPAALRCPVFTEDSFQKQNRHIRCIFAFIFKHLFFLCRMPISIPSQIVVDCKSVNFTQGSLVVLKYVNFYNIYIVCIWRYPQHNNMVLSIHVHHIALCYAGRASSSSCVLTFLPHRHVTIIVKVEACYGNLKYMLLFFSDAFKWYGWSTPCNFMLSNSTWAGAASLSKKLKWNFDVIPNRANSIMLHYIVMGLVY